MPIYEYRCEKCGSVFEKVQKFSAGLEHKCEKCGYESAKRVMSTTAFHLKGGGWYKDGYSSSKSSGDSSSSSSEPSSATSSSSGVSTGSCSTTTGGCGASGCAK